MKHGWDGSPQGLVEPGLRILLAADDEQRSWLRAALREIEGAELVEADSSLGALEVILGGGADLCLADADDPLLGGLDLLQLALSAPGGAGLPILILATPGGEPNRRRALAAGAWDCLLKPVDPGVALRRVGCAVEALKARIARQRDRTDALPRILLADPDPAYLQFGVRALSDICSVETAATGAAAAVGVLRDKPALAVLARSFHPALRRILDNRPEDFSAVSRVMVLDGDESGPGVIPRTLDPHELEAKVSDALNDHSRTEQAGGDGLSSLPAVLSAAVERFFFVMTGETATPANAEHRAEAFAWIDLRMARATGPLRLAVEIECPLTMRSRLAVAVYGEKARYDEAEEQSVLCELVNVVAGRLKAFCWEQRLDVELGLPRSGSQPPARPPDTRLYWSGAFRWQEQICKLSCYTLAGYQVRSTPTT